MASNNRLYLPIIDSLRGIAALMVCVFHFICTTTGFFDENIRHLFSFGRLGVQIFFVISGVVIPLSLMKESYTLKKLPRFLGKRVMRIEPPYLISLVLVIAYTHIRNFVPGVNNIDLRPETSDIILHLGYLVPFFKEAHWLTPVYWTLAIEFQYYLVMSLIFPFIHSNYLYRTICIVLLLTSSFFIRNNGFLFLWLPLFIIGIYTALYLSERIKKLELYLGLIVSSILFVFQRSMIEVIFGLITALVIINFSAITSKLGRFFGKISYSIYLLHTIIGTSFINFMVRYGHTMCLKLLIVLGGLLITIISSYLFYLFVEKPSQSLSKRISLK